LIKVLAKEYNISDL
jgi:hypothetical protein